MFLVVLMIYGMGYVFGDESIGMNKTVGWAYDISNQMFYCALLYGFSILLFFVGYLLLAILGRKTNYHFSIVHFVLIIGAFILLNFSFFIFSTIIGLLSIAVFMKNIFSSYK
ncbi:hypothetical protein [Flavobacterium flavipallidum]|uniref:Uncharacterized protein n=1 Tax=Flavobacterium flavipallidum TaxID=3139140 RepID=A0ABU9HIN2_9FLAO